MRNLKKILALVLALVMSLSLMATAGATETTSASSANAYATAAEVLQGLKVLEGYPDGQMHYEDSFTRPQAAAVFYRVDTKDVTNTNKDLYTNAPFSDIGADHWARGYIAYCYDNKIVKGMGDGSFGDKSPLTGYQVLVMALRELGYGQNNEFDGDSYKLKTASTATQIGMLKGVTPIDENRLGEPATRGLMAQLVFNMLLQPTVRYNALYQTYEPDGNGTLGKQKFGLEEVEGVVVANEYADIRAGKTSPMSKGTTVLRNSNGTYELDATTYLEDLGETRKVYTVPNGNLTGKYLKCVALADEGKDHIVYDDGEELDADEVSDLIDGTVAARRVNFGELTGTESTTTTIRVTYQASTIVEAMPSALSADSAITDFAVKYRLSATAIADHVKVESRTAGGYTVTYKPEAGDLLGDTDKDDVVAGTGTYAKHVYSIVDDYPDPAIRRGDRITYYRVELEPGATYLPADEDLITAIFYRASAGNTASAGLIATGHVFRGTQVTDDFSNNNRYAKFVEDCLYTETSTNTVRSNEAGWWLKVIDNDHDGITDWVLQTRYTVAKVTAVNADTGALTLDTTDVAIETTGTSMTNVNDTSSWDPDDSVNYSASRITSAKAYPGEEDKIEAGSVVYYAKIDGKYYAWKCPEITGTVQSVHRQNLTVTVDGTTYDQSGVHEHSLDPEIESGVVKMSETVSLTLYMDGYNNVAAFSQNLTGGLVLVLDGWANRQINDTEYAVRVWNKDTLTKDLYNVTSGGSLFISGNNDANGWNRVRTVEGVNTKEGYARDDVRTLMAYMETDGNSAKLVPVDTVYDVRRLNSREVHVIELYDDSDRDGTQDPDTNPGYNKGDVTNKGIPMDRVDETSASTLTKTGRIQQTPSYAYNTPYTQTVTNPASVRVRAMTTTTYYFVYNGVANAISTDQLYVTQFTGYTAASAWIRATDVINHVENVYAVGTRSEDVEGVYYSADVVVVELKDTFRLNSRMANEVVLLYSHGEEYVGGGLEHVKAIRQDGTNDTDLYIDLGGSRTYVEAKAEADEDNNMLAAYGLYWLTPTNKTYTDSKGEVRSVYTVERLNHYDIVAYATANNGGVSDYRVFDIGTIHDSNPTSGDVHVSSWYWYNDATDDGALAPKNLPSAVIADGPAMGGLDGHTHYGLDGTNVSNVVRRASESGKYYSLSYNNAGYGTASAQSYADVFNSSNGVLRQWNSAGGTSAGHYNYVLVRYSGANIVYAVTFPATNAARSVWQNILPDVAVPATVASPNNAKARSEAVKDVLEAYADVVKAYKAWENNRTDAEKLADLIDAYNTAALVPDPDNGGVFMNTTENDATANPAWRFLSTDSHWSEYKAGMTNGKLEKDKLPIDIEIAFSLGAGETAKVAHTIKGVTFDANADTADGDGGVGTIKLQGIPGGAEIVKFTVKMAPTGTELLNNWSVDSWTPVTVKTATADTYEVTLTHTPSGGASALSLTDALNAKAVIASTDGWTVFLTDVVDALTSGEATLAELTKIAEMVEKATDSKAMVAATTTKAAFDSLTSAALAENPKASDLFGENITSPSVSDLVQAAKDKKDEAETGGDGSGSGSGSTETTEYDVTFNVTGASVKVTAPTTQDITADANTVKVAKDATLTFTVTVTGSNEIKTVTANDAPLSATSTTATGATYSTKITGTTTIVVTAEESADPVAEAKTAAVATLKKEAGKLGITDTTTQEAAINASTVTTTTAVDNALKAAIDELWASGDQTSTASFTNKDAWSAADIKTYIKGQNIVVQIDGAKWNANAQTPYGGDSAGGWGLRLGIKFSEFGTVGNTWKVNIKGANAKATEPDGRDVDIGTSANNSDANASEGWCIGWISFSELESSNTPTIPHTLFTGTATSDGWSQWTQTHKFTYGDAGASSKEWNIKVIVLDAE